jgi:hypothetical protein
LRLINDVIVGLQAYIKNNKDVDKYIINLLNKSLDLRKMAYKSNLYKYKKILEHLADYIFSLKEKSNTLYMSISLPYEISDEAFQIIYDKKIDNDVFLERLAKDLVVIMDKTQSLENMDEICKNEVFPELQEIINYNKQLLEKFLLES